MRACVRFIWGNRSPITQQGMNLEAYWNYIFMILFFSLPVFNNSFYYTVIPRIKPYSHFEILNESFIKEMLLIEIQIDFNNKCHLCFTDECTQYKYSLEVERSNQTNIFWGHSKWFATEPRWEENSFFEKRYQNARNTIYQNRSQIRLKTTI